MPKKLMCLILLLLLLPLIPVYAPSLEGIRTFRYNTASGWEVFHSLDAIQLGGYIYNVGYMEYSQAGYLVKTDQYGQFVYVNEIVIGQVGPGGTPAYTYAESITTDGTYLYVLALSKGSLTYFHPYVLKFAQDGNLVTTLEISGFSGLDFMGSEIIYDGTNLLLACTTNTTTIVLIKLSTSLSVLKTVRINGIRSLGDIYRKVAVVPYSTYYIVLSNKDGYFVKISNDLTTVAAGGYFNYDHKFYDAVYDGTYLWAVGLRVSTTNDIVVTAFDPSTMSLVSDYKISTGYTSIQDVRGIRVVEGTSSFFYIGAVNSANYEILMAKVDITTSTPSAVWGRYLGSGVQYAYYSPTTYYNGIAYIVAPFTTTVSGTSYNSLGVIRVSSSGSCDQCSVTSLTVSASSTGDYITSATYTIVVLTPSPSITTNPPITDITYSGIVTSICPLPPAISFRDYTFTYNYNGYQVSAVGNYADSCLFNGSAYDSYTTINTTAKNFTKTVKLPAGIWKINATVIGEGTATSIKTVTVNRATPGLGLYLNGTAGDMTLTYGNKVNATGLENNLGDNDLSYCLYLGTTQLGCGSRITNVFQPPAGTYTISYQTAGGQNYTSNSVSRSITVNKATPQLSISCSGGTWMQGGTISSSENNLGDNDLQYETYLDTYLGGPGTYTVYKKSGTYTAVFNTSGGQNYTANSISCLVEITKAWEKTDNVAHNTSYMYDLDTYAVPLPSSARFSLLNTSVEVGKHLYGRYEVEVNNTNGNTGLTDTFTNIFVNVTVKSGWRNITKTSAVIPSLPYNNKYTYAVDVRTLPAFEKSFACSSGHCSFTITVNASEVASLPVIFYLHDLPADWANRTKYSITVDGKTTGFTFDPSTLRLEISTTFSHSSLGVGDHTVDLTYSVGEEAPPYEVVVPPGYEVVVPPGYEVVVPPGGIAGLLSRGVIEFLGILIPLKFLLLILLFLAALIFFLLIAKKKRRVIWARS
ncbi:MAG: hypothetical protein ACP5KE_06525 [Candidatus Methanodesulfokora sp.]